MRKIVCLFYLSFWVFCSVLSGEGKAYSYQTVQNDPFKSRIYKLDNGLTVYLSQNKREPRLQTYIGVRAGSADERPDSTGLAHYFEHMMFKGSSKIASLDWNKEEPLLKEIEDLFEKRRQSKDPAEQEALYKKIDALSAEAAKYSNDEYWKVLQSMGAKGTNAWTSYDETVYTNDIPVNQLEKFLKLESERFSNIALRRFHTELETVYEEFNRRQDRDMSVLYGKAMESLFQEHPYGRFVLGLPEHIKSPSMKDIHNFFNMYYVPENMAVVIAGDLDYDKTIALVDKYFGKLPTRNLPISRDARSVKEKPLEKPRIVTVSGPEQESLLLCYRFKASPETETLLDMLAAVLQNGNCGLFDTDLIQKQKVQSLSSGASNLSDYFLLMIRATPRSGQTLEELKSLILAEIQKLKDGKFDDWLMKAVVNNLRYDLLTQTENRQAAAAWLLNSFLRNIPFDEALACYDRMEAVTKEQLVHFANQNLDDNYVVAYKKTGVPDHKVKAEKPPITPVTISEEPSPFSSEIAAMTVSEGAKPEFIDFSKALQKETLKKNLDFYYIPNADNERFALYYVFPAGSFHDLKLPLAFGYASLLGTDQYSLSELKKEFYKLALSYSFSVSEDRAEIVIYGLQRNFDEAVRLLEHVISSLKPEQEVYDNYVGRILKARENAKKSADAQGSHALNYAAYGRLNPRTWQIPQDELKKISPSELTGLVKNIRDFQHDIVYYGPEKQSVVYEKLLKEHKTSAELKQFAPPKEFVINAPSENRLYLVDYPNVKAQAILMRPVSGELFKLDVLPFSKMYSTYVRSFVWNEIREKSGLAYSAYSYFAMPQRLNNRMASYGVIETQPDKLKQALLSLVSLMNNLPSSEMEFDSAKNSILQGIATSRIYGDGIYFTWADMKKFGVDYDWRSLIFRETEKMTPEEFDHQFKQYVANRPFYLVIVADLKSLDVKELEEKFGKATILRTEDIF